MDRRSFLKTSGVVATAWASGAGFGSTLLPLRLLASESAMWIIIPTLRIPVLGRPCAFPQFSTQAFSPTVLRTEIKP